MSHRHILSRRDNDTTFSRTIIVTNDESQAFVPREHHNFKEEMTMKLTRSSFLILLGAMTFSTFSWAQSCSNNTIKGSYGFITSIRVRPPKPGAPTGRIRFIGGISYDGSGQAKAIGLSIRTDGQEIPVNYSGQYEVTPNCLGVLTLTTGSNSQTVWRFVIVGGGMELLTVVSHSPETTPFEQKRL
jgi:hypothetical protein